MLLLWLFHHKSSIIMAFFMLFSLSHTNIGGYKIGDNFKIILIHNICCVNSIKEQLNVIRCHETYKLNIFILPTSSTVINEDYKLKN